LVFSLVVHNRKCVSDLAETLKPFFFGLFFFAIHSENHEIGHLQLMFPPRKYDETYFYFNRYDQSKGLAIIQDFATHCEMENEQMAKGRNSNQS
jgi:hypothetical protein